MEKAYLITENTDLDKLKLDINKYDRIYFWDAYCEHNLFYFLSDEKFTLNIISLNKPITLITPIISNKNIDKLFLFIDKVKDLDWFEIVVNEHWILNKLINNYKNVKLIWWNFLSGQNKDPFLKIFKDKDIHKSLTIDNNYYFELLKNNNISLVELYNTFQWVNVDLDYNFSLYFPYVVYSINRYCPSKLIHDNKNYLTIVEDCDWCMWKIPQNFNMDLKMKTDMSKNFFRWNKQLYLNESMIQSDKIKRIIYNYDLLW